MSSLSYYSSQKDERAKPGNLILFVTPAFSPLVYSSTVREFREKYTLLSHYAASSGNSLAMFGDNLYR